MASSSSPPPAAAAKSSASLSTKAKKTYLQELLAELGEEERQQTEGASVLRPTDLLRAELELLQDNDDHSHHRRHDAKHPLVQRNEELARALLLSTTGERHTSDHDADHQHDPPEPAAAAADTSSTSSGRRSSSSSSHAGALYQQEIAHSHEELVALNEVLNDRIQMERERCDTLRETLEEYRTIHQVLVKTQRKLENINNNKEKSHTNSAFSPVAAAAAKDDSDDADAVQRQNELLRDDLKYVTDCIQTERLASSSSSSPDEGTFTTNLLHDVLWKLIDGRLEHQHRNPNDDDDDDDDDANPYVQVDDERLLQLLRDETFVVDPYYCEVDDSSSDLVCLVDYLSTSV